jgi:hypothetical protein
MSSVLSTRVESYETVRNVEKSAEAAQKGRTDAGKDARLARSVAHATPSWVTTCAT